MHRSSWEADEQGDEHDEGEPRARVDRHGLDRADREHEDQGQRRQQDGERDLVGRLLTARAFHERDHPVQERLAGSRRNAHDDLVRQHSRAAGDGRPIPTRLTDDGRRFAGDG